MFNGGQRNDSERTELTKKRQPPLRGNLILFNLSLPPLSRSLLPEASTSPDSILLYGPVFFRGTSLNNKKLQTSVQPVAEITWQFATGLSHLKISNANDDVTY